MKKILHVGNNLKGKQANPTYISFLGPKLEAEGFTLYYTSQKQNKVLRLVDMLLSVYKHRAKVDMVLIDTYSTSNFYYAFLVAELCNLLKTPYITILHGGNLPQRLDNSPWKSKRLFKHSKLNIAPSKYILQEFKKRAYTNIKFIPNAINIEKYKATERGYERLNLLWVRSLTPIYNPNMALEVVRLLQEEGLDVRLTMVGPDPNNKFEELKETIKNQKLRIEYKGKLKQEEWHKLSAGHNIFINTSNFDNMPITLIEVMALGLPIVSTNVGGIPYLIEDGSEGLLCNKNDAFTMANCIKKIHKNPDLRQSLIINARAKAESFSWQNVKALWISALA
ncbi:MAG: glycosyltransferase family 4 protein [Winogradskyella sp.]|nr:glycosyltransferase family 4 protein [Winogradskyella sp.]